MNFSFGLLEMVGGFLMFALKAFLTSKITEISLMLK
ncbi:MAG: hypothetical protein Ct9H90mP13_01640 [Pseudomonadota bacterium]|nr:MAG: hypothetical protein Ct9H90mP13_01640 [Pseudomonadota bacterium]